jgi:hypothetical protein
VQARTLGPRLIRRRQELTESRGGASSRNVQKLPDSSNEQRALLPDKGPGTCEGREGHEAPWRAHRFLVWRHTKGGVARCAKAGHSYHRGWVAEFAQESEAFLANGLSAHFAIFVFWLYRATADVLELGSAVGQDAQRFL